MRTPICDFVNEYCQRRAVRLHMPGHKGAPFLVAEALDITEIDGADVLYNARGIIKESENIAGEIFGTERTLYSAEGSSLSIRAMLYLVKLYARAKGRSELILAGRNAHKTFINTMALLDMPVRWLYTESADGGALSCDISERQLADAISEFRPAAVYITSPDYLGNMADIEKIAEICHATDTLLLVDNAHGAYLNFLEENKHPIALGADMCCDSVHKTLPALTGAGYFHISHSAPKFFAGEAERAMSLFASTSPSYLILQSLDKINPYLAGEYKIKLKLVAEKVKKLRREIAERGFSLLGDEPMKLTLVAKPYGYRGDEVASYLKKSDIIPEFHDADFLVFMFSSESSEEDFARLKRALLALPKRAPITQAPPKIPQAQSAVGLREALYMPRELVRTECAVGRILAVADVACPPAVPIAILGERLSREHITVLKYYGVDECYVVKES